ncbi:hypothetical protein AERO8C_140005 [Aeromonas veronii]|uniref:Uncharacterized protein n=1 Tax=Aeromonas veronii TaxID=654 RepID=A0A653KVH4_AERVE|nr:hypothetical protein AERO8C_140005 [Aeromonas veronii]
MHVHDKAIRLINSPVAVRTSQNTSNWSTGEGLAKLKNVELELCNRHSAPNFLF